MGKIGIKYIILKWFDLALGILTSGLKDKRVPGWVRLVYCWAYWAWLVLIYFGPGLRINGLGIVSSVVLRDLVCKS